MKKYLLIFILMAMPLIAVSPPPATTDTAITQKFVICDADPALLAIDDVIYVNFLEIDYFYIKFAYADTGSGVAHYNIFVKLHNQFLRVHDDFASLAAAQAFVNDFTQPIP